MDANATLNRLRELAKEVFRIGADPLAEPLSQSDMEDFAAYFQDLDNWLRKGGFLPTDWKQQ